MSQKILPLNTQINTETEAFLPAAAKIIAGNPSQKMWPHYTNQSNEFHTGIWQADIGKWEVSYSEDEYCFILEGKNVVTNADGETITVQAGDHFVIPAGFSGTWEVVEPTRKVYVIYGRV